MGWIVVLKTKAPKALRPSPPVAHQFPNPSSLILPLLILSSQTAAACHVQLPCFGEMRDFYMEISFHFESSVIPFVGKIAPSNMYNIWKCDDNLLEDTSLAGFDRLKIQCADQSFLFLGEGDQSHDVPPGLLLVLNRDEKKNILQRVRECRVADDRVGHHLVLRSDEHVLPRHGRHQGGVGWADQLKWRQEILRLWMGLPCWLLLARGQNNRDPDLNTENLIKDLSPISSSPSAWHDSPLALHLPPTHCQTRVAHHGVVTSDWLAQAAVGRNPDDQGPIGAEVEAKPGSNSGKSKLL